ncbi:MAG: S8 family serine peptidase [Actinobacteria bacterium]|nr:S8 family serine peptidase [Actinomycetota bacterium]
MSRHRWASVVLAAATSLMVLAAGDPYRPVQWGLQRIGAERAWSVADGAGAVVAVVDTGVDLDHPDLADRVLRRQDGTVVGLDVIDEDDDPDDPNGHGTVVAGIVAATADNDIGVAGVAPGAWIMPIRVLDADAGGDGDDVDRAIRWAVDNGADVVNVSLEAVLEDGSTAPVDPLLAPRRAPTEAVAYAWDHGVLVVAAAGNSGSGSSDYPDSSPVVLVGASDEDDRRAGFSDTVREDALLAPGVAIISTWCDPCGPGGTPSYGEADGTSFAAPHVSGALAVLLSSGLSPGAALARVRQTAVDLGPPGPDREHGVGRLDLAAASGVPPEAGPDPAPTVEPAPTPPATAAPPTSVSQPDVGFPPPARASSTPSPQRSAADEPSRPAILSEPGTTLGPVIERSPPQAAAADGPPGRSWVGLLAASLLVVASSGVVLTVGRPVK